MKLNEHMMRLIAVGASVAVNCQECLEINLALAKKCNADVDEITQAIWVGRMVRKAGASKMDEHISRLIERTSLEKTNAECSCKS